MPEKTPTAVTAIDDNAARQIVVERMRSELALLRQAVLLRGPGKNRSSTFRYITCEYILVAVIQGQGDAHVLLRTPNPLAAIYREYRWYFDRYDYENFRLFVNKSIEDCVNNTLRIEFLHAKGWIATNHGGWPPGNKKKA